MNSSDDVCEVDRERVAITARSVVANVDVLAEEGLTSAATERALELAEMLVDRSRDRGETRERGAALRELLAAGSGPTSVVLVTWLDDALQRPV